MRAGGAGIALGSICSTPQALWQNLNIIYSTMCQLKPISPAHLFRKMTSCNALPQRYVSVILTNQSLLDRFVSWFSSRVRKEKGRLRFSWIFQHRLWNGVRALVVIKCLDSARSSYKPDEGLSHIYLIYQSYNYTVFHYEMCFFSDISALFESSGFSRISLFSSIYIFILKWDCFYEKVLWYSTMAKMLLNSINLAVWSAVVHHGALH